MYVLNETVTGGSENYNYALTIDGSSVTTISGTASGSPDPYSYVTCTTDSLFETDSGADTTTLDEVDSFSFAADSSDAYEYTITGPPSSTITDESTTSASDSGGTLENPSNGTLIPAYWDTYAIGLAAKMGTSPLDAPIQDGTTSGEWDTSQGLVSALGGQDMHALQFTGSEIQPALYGSAIVLEQGVDGTGTWTSHPSAIGYRRQGYVTGGSHGGSGIWTSHPSAIGYRRQGYVTGGSHGGSGSATITIAAVAPEFDSGMNQGTDQDEMERLENFSQGAQENPTVAQTQPISRAQQQVSETSSGGRPVNGRHHGSVDRPRAGDDPVLQSGNGPWPLQSVRGVLRRHGGIPNPTADGNTSSGPRP